MRLKIFLLCTSLIALPAAASEATLALLDYEALKQTELYKRLEKQDQKTKDEALRNASGASFRYSRNATTIALLSGAHPMIEDHAPFEHQGVHPNQGFLNAVRNNDSSLVTLFFQRGADPLRLATYWDESKDPWLECNTIEMCDLLVQYGIPLYNQEKRICALKAGIIQATRYPSKSVDHLLSYIEHLLILCPEAIHFDKGLPLTLAVSADEDDCITIKSHKKILRLLVNHGANPHESSTYNKETWAYRPKIAHWLNNYYEHVHSAKNAPRNKLL